MVVGGVNPEASCSIHSLSTGAGRVRSGTCPSPQCTSTDHYSVCRVRDCDTEQVEVPVQSIQRVASVYELIVDENKLELLTSLANEAENSLSSGEIEKFLSLLCSYADIFASSMSDLERTNKLKHSIDKGGAEPIRQPVH